MCCVIAAASWTAACSDITTDADCIKPSINSIRLDPNADNVLSMIVSADVVNAREVFVRFGTNSALDSITPSFGLTGIPVTVPVLGLLPQTTYSAQLVARNTCAETTSDVVSLQTGALPPDLPQYTAAGTAPPGPRSERRG